MVLVHKQAVSISGTTLEDWGQVCHVSLKKKKKKDSVDPLQLMKIEEKGKEKSNSSFIVISG